MFNILILGLLTFIAFALVMKKIGIPTFLRMGWVADLVISLAMGMIFIGTFTGMATGLIAGIFLSIFLSVCRRFSPKPEPKKRRRR
jgi:MFS superfamily sulfate permease-like transporter